MDEKFKRQLEEVEDLILSETNVKELEYNTGNNPENIIQKSIKANFKTLGPKYGKQMKDIAKAISKMEQANIISIEAHGIYTVTLEDGNYIDLEPEDVEITAQDIPGWLVQTEGGITVALDITLTEELKEIGRASCRERV